MIGRGVDPSRGEPSEVEQVPGRLDLRLLIPAIVAWALGALALGWPVHQRGGVAAACAALTGVVGLIGWRRGGRGWPGLIGLTGVASTLVLGASTVHGAARELGDIADLAESRAAIQARGVVLTEPIVRRPAGRDEPMVMLRLRLTSVSARGTVRTVNTPVLVRAGADWATLRWRDEVKVAGRLSPAEPGEEVLAILAPRGPPQRPGEPHPLLASTEHMRAGLRRAVDHLPADARGLVPGLVIGDTSQTPQDLTDAMQVTGLTHLSAVSGSNVSLILAAALGLSQVVGVRRRWRPVVGLVVLAWFVLLARPEPSVARAATMGAIGVIGFGMSRRAIGLPVLSAAVLALLTLDPWLARSYGFALSTLATLGLLLFVAPWSEAIGTHLPRRVRWAAPVLAVPLAAQVMCAPVIVLLQGSVSTVSVLANVLAAPLVAPTTIVGISVALVALVSSALASWLAWVAALPALGIAWIGRSCAQIPGGTMPWPDGAFGAGLLAVLTVLALLVGPWLMYRARAAPVVALGVIVVLAAGSVPARTFTWPPQGWLLVACDVGQGDALVLATGRGRAVVIDAGAEPAPVDGCLGRLGVTQVEAVILTHFHADHVGGLEGILDGRRVERIIVTPVAEPVSEALRVRQLGAAAQIPVSEVVAGDHLRFAGVEADVWWPAQPISSGSVPNNASIVLAVRSGPLDAVLLGDIEREAGGAIMRHLRSHPDLLASARGLDVVKVAHHGSANLDPALAEQLAAPVAVISVGADNSYGHPAPSLLRLLAREGSAVWRTDQRGDIAIIAVGDRLAVVGSASRW
ncbi:DNA internalization-related competence protein ComEC/Rec2 [Janibacter sp. GXQ6167]|uniref:DNA internalization-related competence protein ComEC/Rec2 n=1 Tax=Janibacter sp. GXQ6167 TaxID=3240791 RepID=UPI00352507B1